MNNFRSILKSLIVFNGFTALLCSHTPDVMAVSLGNNLLNDPGFETTTSLGSFNSPPVGIWVAEAADLISIPPPLPPVNGISPFEGNGMIRLNEAPLFSSQIAQYVDISAWATQVDTGNVTARLNAYFNSPTDETIAQLSIFTAAPPQSSGIIPSRTFLQGTGLLLDNDPLTWEMVTIDALIPSGTRFINADLGAVNGTLPLGAFVDVADLSLISDVPEPLSTLGTVTALIFGGILLKKPQKS